MECRTISAVVLTFDLDLDKLCWIKLNSCKIMMSSVYSGVFDRSDAVRNLMDAPKQQREKPYSLLALAVGMVLNQCNSCKHSLTS